MSRFGYAQKMEHNQPVIPNLWSFPTSNWEFVKAARDNVLNIIPNDTMTTDYISPPRGIMPMVVHYASTPEYTSKLLRDDVISFPKANSILLSLEPATPRSIFITHGEIWKDQHDKLIKVFSYRNVQQFSNRITDIAQKFVHERLDQLQNSDDITELMQDITFDVIAEIIFSDTKDPRLHILREKFESYIDRAVRLRMSDFFTLQIPGFPNLRNITERRLIRDQHQIYEELIAERVANPSAGKEDFLEHLIEAYDYRNAPTHENMINIRDNLATFLIAGHETTAMTLSWGLYAAGFFPDIQKQMSKEADLPHDARPITESFIHETLRIYPPAPLLVRTASASWQSGDMKIKKGDGVIIPTITVHRHRELWDDPDAFLPERFVDFKPKKYTYLPFGAGPRVCIGMSLAMMEAKIIFGELIKALDIKSPTHMPNPYQILTLRSRNGIKINANPR